MSDKLDWDVALIGYDPTQRARYLDAIIDARQSGGPEPEMDYGRRKTDLVRLIDDDDGRRSFYEALLKIQWLPSAIRAAVMKVLDQSLQKHKRSIEDARTVTLEFLVKECKAQMRANGERPQGGIHDAAVAQVATSQGMSPEALKQRITRVRGVPAGKATDLIFGSLREVRGLINDSPQAAVFRFATQRIVLLGVGAQALFQVAFPRRRRPLLPSRYRHAQAVRLGRRPLVCPGVTSELTKGSSNGNARSPHSWRHYAPSPAKRSRK